MKKSLIVLLSMLFVLGITLTAFAEVEFGGDARVRGIWEKNWDMDSDTDQDERYWDQRIRLKATGKVGDGVEVRTRLVLSDGTWDGAANTNGSVTLDYGYLHIPIGPVTLDLGRQNSDWGNKFLEWNVKKDRAQVSATFGNTTVAVYTDKDDEINTTGDDNLKDVDRYAAYVIQSFGDIEAGILGMYTNDAREKDKTTGVGEDGTAIDIFVNANVSGIGVKGEFAYLGGDRNKTTDKDNDENSPLGAFVSASAGVGNVTVGGLFAISRNGYTADSHFTPTVMIGTDNPTAIADFGESMEGTGTANSFLACVSADFNATPELSVYGKAAYAKLKSYSSDTFASGEDSASLVEVDAGMKYQIAQNTTYSLDVGYMKPNDLTTEDDAAMSVAHKVEVAF